MKYYASRNKNNFWLNLRAKREFANSFVNTEPANHVMNILILPLSVQGSLKSRGGEEWDLSLAVKGLGGRV